ncbi:hypothetical protein CRYUN_Cryun08bG0159800 [Craigia yunnanensis]
MSSILKMPVSIPAPSQNLSFSKYLLFPTLLFLHTKLSSLSLHTPPPPNTIIRMGGGPRTYPGGVSKWQWKRMQAKKAKQLLKARFARERHICEMRKRAELKAAVSELERPWEVVEKAPNLFSVSADEQVKVLADRFQKPGSFDMWSDRDGPQLFDIVDGLPSPRKKWEKNGVKWRRKGIRRSMDTAGVGSFDGKISNLKSEAYDKRSNLKSDTYGKRSNLKFEPYDKRSNLKSEVYDKRSNLKPEVYDMSLQRDGSFGINKKK